MPELPKPPRAFSRFTARFPQAAEAWTLLQQQGSEGPLAHADQRLAKLAIAIGAGKPGAVHSATRKAVAADVSREAMEQLVALAAPTIGLPAAVAAHGWILDVLEPGVEA